MSYLALTWERVRQAHDEAESITRSQASTQAWHASAARRRKTIAQLEAERVHWQAVLEEEVMELLFLLGLTDADGLPQGVKSLSLIHAIDCTAGRSEETPYGKCP